MKKYAFIKGRYIKYGLLGVLALFFVVLIFGSFYNVNEQQNAVVTMFGKVVRTDTAGLHFKLPILQRVSKVDMTTHGIGIGYEVRDGQNITVEDEGVMITSDFNFVDIDFYLEYRVGDPVEYLFNTEEPESVLKNTALACIRSTVSDYSVDDVITTGKSEIQAKIKEELSKKLVDQNVGLVLVNIQIQDAEPPTSEIVQAFKAVETAKQGKETAINNANKYKNEQIPAAEAEVDRITQEAEATKEARIAEASGQVARFNKMYEQYKEYPLITKERLLYETLEEVLPNSKVIITDGKTQNVLPLESFVNVESTEDKGDTTNE